jgi:hypothetical protein
VLSIVGAPLSDATSASLDEAAKHVISVSRASVFWNPSYSDLRDRPMQHWQTIDASSMVKTRRQRIGPETYRSSPGFG